MTKCCVYKCKSNSKKDEQSVLVHRFPKNPRLKTQWLYRMKNSNWKPTVNSVICDNHFTPESFLLPCQNFDSKGRQRKKKRLHADAVPTLFWYNSDKNTSGRKTINSRKAPPPVEIPPGLKLLTPLPPKRKKGQTDHQYFKREPLNEVSDGDGEEDAVYKSRIVKITPKCSSSRFTVAAVGNSPPASIFEAPESLVPHSQVEHNFRAALNPPKEDLSQINLLKKQIEHFELANEQLNHQLRGVKKLFDQDQINLLSGYKQRANWTESVMETANNIRNNCGNGGYEYLRTMGYPFPSVSSLLVKNRRVNNAELLNTVDVLVPVTTEQAELQSAVSSIKTYKRATNLVPVTTEQAELHAAVTSINTYSRQKIDL